MAMVINKKTFSLAILLILAIFVFFLTKYITKQSYKPSSAASNVLLFFDPQNATLPPNTDMRILVNPQGERAAFIRVTVKFDHTKINLTSDVIPENDAYIIPALSDGTKLVSSIDEANLNGKIDAVFLVPPQNISQIPTTTFELTRIGFRSISNQPNQNTEIYFDNQSMQAVDYNTQENLIINSQNATLLLNPSSLAPEPSATPGDTPSPSSEPENMVLNINYKTQSIGTETAEHQLETLITLRDIDGVAFQENRSFNYSDGLYKANFTVQAVEPGIYDLFIKPAFHLQKRLEKIEIKQGDNNITFESTLMAGDFNNNNSITIEDVALILSVYTALSVNPTQVTRKYDINRDGVINIMDISIVLSNYTALTVSGD